MGRYKNLDGTTPDKGLGDFLKWALGRPRPEAVFHPPWRANDGAALRSLRPSLTWVGHATFLQRLGGKMVVTDPIWSSRLGVIRRLAEPGVALIDCPTLDVVTVSHAHYDHLDLPTLRRIGPKARYVVPKDNAELLRSVGLPNVIELDWWESWSWDDLKITLVPAQHWSMRVPWDKNDRLWGGFIYETPEGTSYHAGDTAFSRELFEGIGQRFPRIDWAMLPIGAYEPRWFMKGQHMGPDEAAEAFAILGATNLVAMHWGTFRLTDEPLGEPPARLRAWWAERGLDERRLWIFDIGETRKLAD